MAKIIDNQNTSVKPNPSGGFSVPKSKAEAGGNYTPSTKTHASPVKKSGK